MAFHAPLPFDSFDHYDTSQIFMKWTTPVNFAGIGYNYQDKATINPTAGRCGTGALQVTSASEIVPGTGPSNVFAAISAGVEGVAFRLDAIDSRVHLIRLHSGGTEDAANQFAVGVNTDGTLFAVRAADQAGGTLLGTSTFAVHDGVFYYLEVDYTIDAGAGALLIYINDVLVLNLTGIDTDPVGSGSVNSVQLGRVLSGASTVITFDDYYGLDKTGPAPQNARLGDQKVAMRLPLAGSGSVAGWTAVPGTDHGNMVNQPVPDGDLTYLSAQTPGLDETLLFPPLDVFSGTVYGVAVVPCVRKDDAGYKVLQALVRLAGINYASVETAVPSLTSYAFFSLLYTLNPATSAAWDVATVNGMECGMTVNT